MVVTRSGHKTVRTESEIAAAKHTKLRKSQAAHARGQQRVADDRRLQKWLLDHPGKTEKDYKAERMARFHERTAALMAMRK